MDGDREAVLAVNDATDPHAGLHYYDVEGLGRPDEVHTHLEVDPLASSIAVLRRR